MSCRSDLRMLGELSRAELAFQDPSVGFTVTDVLIDNNPVDVSNLIPADTWFLVAIRNLSDTPLSFSWSCGPSCTFGGSSLLHPYPARPVPALAGRYALPCRAYNCEDIFLKHHASAYHDTWLLVQGLDPGAASVRLQILSCNREDDSIMYTSLIPGIAIPGYENWVWMSGMMGCRNLHVVDMLYQDVDLINKAKWAHRFRTEEDAGILGEELVLSPNEVTRENPAAHWLALREFGARLHEECPSTVRDVTKIFRQDWNARFARFGKSWVMNSHPHMTLNQVKEQRLQRARLEGWWFATDLAGIIERRAAAKLQKAFKASLSDPVFLVCRRRLLREFTCLPCHPKQKADTRPICNWDDGCRRRDSVITY